MKVDIGFPLKWYNAYQAVGIAALQSCSKYIASRLEGVYAAFEVFSLTT